MASMRPPLIIVFVDEKNDGFFIKKFHTTDTAFAVCKHTGIFSGVGISY